MTFEQHVESAKKLIGQHSIDGIKKMKFEELIRLHHNIGRKIRNGLGLWKINLNEHPDEYSMKIIEAIWKS